MSLPLNFILFIVGLILIVKGGDYFVTASVNIAKKSKIPSVIIGATIVSFATFLPEFIVSTVASIQGVFDLAIGNAVGSMIANTALICGLSIAFMPIGINRGSVYKYLILIVGVLFLAISGINRQLDLFEAIVLLIVFIIFFVLSIVDAIKQMKISRFQKEEKNDEKTCQISIFWTIIYFIVGASAIAFGAMTLVNTATNISKFIGISDEFIGLTIVALGTSLPELTTTLIAIRKKECALGYGNIVGANILNLTLILGVTGLIAKGGVPFSNETLFFTIPMLLVCIFLFLLPLLFKSKTYRWQGIGLLALYIVYVTILIISASLDGIFG